MAELLESRCNACRPKSFQCTPCYKNDVTVRKQMAAAKKVEREKQDPVRLFPADTAKAPEVLREDGQRYPPMPEPAPLTLFGVQVFPPPTNLFPPPSTPPSIAAPFLNAVANPFCAPTVSGPPTVPASSIAKKPSPKKPAATPKKPSKVSNPQYGRWVRNDGEKVVTTPESTPTGCKIKRPHNETDLDSDSDDSHTRAAHKSPDASSSSESDDESSVSDGTDDGSSKVALAKPKMPRITKEERTAVCEWIVQPRADGKMLNGRWVRNGGAKGVSMTATSSEVKTSGAYEALAK